jgi:signal transduction histidine kinase
MDGGLVWRRVLLTALLVSIAYYGGAQIGFLLTFPAVPTSIFWLPNSTMLAVFLLAPRRRWWIYAAAALPAHLAVEVQNGCPVPAIAPLFLTNVGDGALAALAIRHFSGGQSLFGGCRNVLIFLMFAVLSPLVVSVLDAGIVVGSGWAREFPLVWFTRCRSNILTNLIWVPAIVIGVQRGFSWWRTSPPRRYLEAFLLAVGLVALGGFMCCGTGETSRSVVALLYGALPLLLWAAARFGLGGEAAALLAFAFLIIWNATHGHGPFTTGLPARNVVTLQVFLTVLSVPLLLLAASWAERRRTESTLREREAQNDSARKLMVTAERRRLASDLHDSVTQSLSATVMMAEILAVTWERDPEQGRRMLAGLKHTTSSALAELRSLLLQLRGGALPKLSLPELLRQLVAELRDRSKASVELALDDAVTLPLGVDLAFFHVAQEALNNVAKHAGANQVHVNLQRMPSGASLSIRDDGAGFEGSAYLPGHLGIGIMNERTAAVGAHLRIDSARGRGTSVTVSWTESRAAPDQSGPLPLANDA